MYESPGYSTGKKILFVVLGIILLAAVLAGNAFLSLYLIEKEITKEQIKATKVITIGKDDLEDLGVGLKPIDGEETHVVFEPPAYFRGKLKTEKDVEIGGKLNVKKEATMKSLNLNKNLVVDGVTLMQGPLTVSDLLTVDNNLNVLGELSVDGKVAGKFITTNNLTIDDSLTLNQPFNSEGASPSASSGVAAGPGSSASASGNNMAGTVKVKTGNNTDSGTVVRVNFKNAHTRSPKIMVTPLGPGSRDMYVKRDKKGFSIGVSQSLSRGSHEYDYIVMY